MIYLDHAATSWPKPQRVLDAMTACVLECVGNPSRAGHKLSVRAERVVSEARTKLARFVGADDPRRIIHCFNGTDALNIAIKGALRPCDHVITTVLEHNSVSRPLQRLVDDRIITITHVPIGDDGRIDPDAVRRAITPHTRLIALTHASNVTGIIQPVPDVGRIAREHDLLLLVDAAQSAGLIDLNVNDLSVDLLVFSGHKSLLGPSGTGVLYVGERTSLSPWREGGTGGDSIKLTQPEELPTLLEAGTPNMIGLAGLTAAIAEIDPARSLAHERSLMHRIVDGFGEIPRVQIVGNPSPGARVGVLSFNIADMQPTDVSAILDQSFDIAVRPGLHCAPFAHQALNTFPDGAVRASLGWSTTTDEVDQFIRAVSELAEAQ